MKKWLLLLLLVPLYTLAQTPEKDIIGKWEGIDNTNDKGLFIFNEDGYAYLEYNGVRAGGKEFDYDGKKGSLRYNLNSMLKPMQLDFILKDFASGDELKLYFIIEFVTKDQLKICAGYDSYPKEFTKEETLVFSRVVE